MDQEGEQAPAATAGGLHGLAGPYSPLPVASCEVELGPTAAQSHHPPAQPPPEASRLLTATVARYPAEEEVQQLRQQAAAMLRAAVWISLLWSGYGLQRWLCSLGLPYDCDSAPAGIAFRTLTLLALAGGAAGWLAGVTAAARFAWLASPGQAYLWLAFFATLPAYSALSNAPALRASLSSIDSWGAGMAAVAALGAAAATAAVGWHLWHAYQAGAASCILSAGMDAAAAVSALEPGDLSPAGPAAQGTRADHGTADAGSPPQSRCLQQNRSATMSVADAERGLLLLPGTSAGQGSSGRVALRRRRRHAGLSTLALFLLPRLLPLAFFASWAAALHANGAYSLHLHHYALGWGLATFGAFSHPVSGLTLAVGSAIMVQVCGGGRAGN